MVSVGVFLPLVVLTYMQYRSLTELQIKTKGAFKENLRQGFTFVQREMKQRLEEIGAQTLNPIGGIHLSSAGAEQQIEKHFADVKHSHPEVEEIFVFAYSGSKQETNSYAYVYSDTFVKTAQAEFTSKQSEILSLFDGTRIAQGFVDGNRKYLFVHHSCPRCAPSMRQGGYLFYPLTDATNGKQSGFAGVLLNQAFVRDHLIAGSIGKTINAYHGNNAASDIAFTISDENNQVLYSNAPAHKGHFLESNFDPPFSNWRAAVGLMNTNLDDLARDSFLRSAGATLLILVFLLGGIALTLRATDREARLAQAKSNFVANVSHELKTPLSLLSLFSEILELGRVKSEEKKIEYYRIIRHESRRLNKMIDNILDFSKIEAGRKTYASPMAIWRK